MGPEALFRRRLRQLIRLKYPSIDRFYLETHISKGHLSEILRGKGSPSVATLVKIARALEVDLTDLFVFPELGDRHRAIELIQAARPETIRHVVRLLQEDSPHSRHERGRSPG